MATATSAAWADDAAAPRSSGSALSGLSPELSFLLLAGLAGLALLVAVLGAVLGAIWWRMRSSAALNRPVAPPTALPEPAAAVAAVAAVAAAAASAPPEPADEAPPARRFNFKVPALVDENELIEQTEFLSLLGERDAAVGLLDAYIDSEAGVQSPVWLHLLKIHRRFGDRQSFERLGPRYRQHFGIEAPPWASDLPASPAAESSAPMAREAYRPDPYLPSARPTSALR